MDAVEDIKDRLSVDEVVGTYVHLKRAGRNFKGLCPFHEEKTPSFVVSPERGVYHCFGCGEGGDIFTFVERMDGLDFRGALEYLAERAGVDLPEQGDGGQQQAQYKQRLREANAAAAKYYHIQLGRNQEAKRYVTQQRGLGEDAIKSFQLGFAPKGGQRLVAFLGKHGFSQQELLDAGLARQYRGQVQDMFRDRIMIPFFDSSGHVVGFTGRTLSDDAAGPKYLNTPQTRLFDKSRFVFGLYQAKDAIRTCGEVVMVEGNLDVLQSHQAGIGHVVAVSGTALTMRQVKQLARLSESATFAFDGDSAGVKATERALPLAQEAGVDLYIADLPADEDPDDIIRDNPARWQRLLEEKVYVVDWLLDQLSHAYDTHSAQGKRKLTDRAIPVLRRLQDDVEREHYVTRLADVVGTAPATIAQKLNAHTDASSRDHEPAVRAKSDPLPPGDDISTVASALASLAVTYPDTRKALDGLNSDFLDENVYPVLEHVRGHDREVTADSVPQDLHSHLNYVKILLVRGEETYGQWSALDRQVEAFSLAHRLHKLQNQHKKQRLSQQIAAAEAAGDDQQRRALLEAYNNLHKNS